MGLCKHTEPSDCRNPWLHWCTGKKGVGWVLPGRSNCCQEGCDGYEDSGSPTPELYDEGVVVAVQNFRAHPYSRFMSAEMRRDIEAKRRQFNPGFGPEPHQAT